MSDDVEPAMSPEDWASVKKYGADSFMAEAGPRIWDHPHAAAALQLHGQPFGFTRGDVEQLRRIADEAEDSYRAMDPGGPSVDPDWARDLADRIEALLPPEGK